MKEHDESLLTIAEICKLLKISRTTFYRHRKLFPDPVRIGSLLRYSRRDLEELGFIFRSAAGEGRESPPAAPRDPGER